MSISITIPHWHPATVNQLLSGHWSKAAKLKKSDRQMVAHYSRHAIKATGKRILELAIILKKGQRAADPDAYFKSLLDALVAAEMLTDDNRQGVELMPVQFKRNPKDWGTIIGLSEAHV